MQPGITNLVDVRLLTRASAIVSVGGPARERRAGAAGALVELEHGSYPLRTAAVSD
jgi:hypothetical protein